MPIRPEKPRGVMFVTLDQLETFMSKRKINTADWLTHSPTELLNAIHRGDIEVFDDMEFGPVRQISAVQIDVAFTDQQREQFFLFSKASGERGITEVLNAKDVYMNQRVKNNALDRIMAEVLGINKFQIPIYQGTEVQVSDDTLYPGLNTKNVLFHYELGIDPSQHRPEYRSRIDDSQIFVWRPGKTQFR